MTTRLTAAALPNRSEAGSPQVKGGNSLRSIQKVRPASFAKGVAGRIAVVDDDVEIHRFINELAALGHFTLVHSAYTGAEALEHLPEERPDAVIMDVRMPDMSGIDCARKLKTVLPVLPIIILTGYPDGGNFFRSVMEQAKGFLFKPVLANELLKAIDDVLKGEFALAKQAIPFLIQLVRQVGQVTQENRLTKREEEILACLFQDMQDKEIAAALGIGTATVHTHMHRLFEKLGVHSRQGIIAKYFALA